MVNITPIENKLGQGHMMHLSNKGLARKLNSSLISMILTTVHNHIPQTNKPQYSKIVTYAFREKHDPNGKGISPAQLP